MHHVRLTGSHSLGRLEHEVNAEEGPIIRSTTLTPTHEGETGSLLFCPSRYDRATAVLMPSVIFP